MTEQITLQREETDLARARKAAAADWRQLIADDLPISRAKQP